MHIDKFISLVFIVSQVRFIYYNVFSNYNSYLLKPIQFIFKNVFTTFLFNALSVTVKKEPEASCRLLCFYRKLQSATILTESRGH